MVGVQFTPCQRAFMVLRFAETHGTVQVQQEFRRFGRAPPTPVTIRNNFKKYRDEGTSQNLCKQRSGRPRTARSLRNIGTQSCASHGRESESLHRSPRFIKWKGELQESELFLETFKNYDISFCAQL